MIEFIHNLTNPDWIMQHGGLYVVMLIVFTETGLPFGFFLPGDPLLFITGMILAHTLSPGAPAVLQLLFWILLIAACGVAGNYLGYWFGKRSGAFLLRKKDSWLFKKRHLMQAKEFYEQKGGAAIVLARFLPVVRTFAPIIAGMVGMHTRKFSWYNVLGSFLWVGGIVTAGFLLGENAWVQRHLEKVILGIVLLTTAPVLVKMVAGKRKASALPAAEVPVAEKKS